MVFYEYWNKGKYSICYEDLKCITLEEDENAAYIVVVDRQADKDLWVVLRKTKNIVAVYSNHGKTTYHLRNELKKLGFKWNGIEWRRIVRDDVEATELMIKVAQTGIDFIFR